MLQNKCSCSNAEFLTINHKNTTARISLTRNIGNLALCPLIVAGLAGHVDGRCGHANRRPPRHNVQVHRLLGNVGGGLLDVTREAEAAAETRHEVACSDELHAGVVRLQDQLETSTCDIIEHTGISTIWKLSGWVSLRLLLYI